MPLVPGQNNYGVVVVGGVNGGVALAYNSAHASCLSVSFMLHLILLCTVATILLVPAWASSFKQDTSVFPMLGFTGSIPQF